MEIGDAFFKIRRNPEEVRTARGRNVMFVCCLGKTGLVLGINYLILNNNLWILLSS